MRGVGIFSKNVYVSVQEYRIHLRKPLPFSSLLCPISIYIYIHDIYCRGSLLHCDDW